MTRDGGFAYESTRDLIDTHFSRCLYCGDLVNEAGKHTNCRDRRDGVDLLSARSSHERRVRAEADTTGPGVYVITLPVVPNQPSRNIDTDVPVPPAYHRVEWWDDDDPEPVAHAHPACISTDDVRESYLDPTMFNVIARSDAVYHGGYPCNECFPDAALAAANVWWDSRDESHRSTYYPGERIRGESRE